MGVNQCDARRKKAESVSPGMYIVSSKLICIDSYIKEVACSKIALTENDSS